MDSFTEMVAFIIMASLSLTTNANLATVPGLSVIPYPQEVIVRDQPFRFPERTLIAIGENPSAEDVFTAEGLVRDLKNDFNIEASITRGSKGSILLTRKGAQKRVGSEGYLLSASPDGIVIRASAPSGLFYGTQTLRQLIQRDQNSYTVPGLEITDWPGIKERAVHYDTKHHQDRKEYVESFIRDLAYYKINMLIWEWEDKLEYTSHPEIGAPGAFTIAEMQHFTSYARQYHIQLVPLVQGLGHASFILKWPVNSGMREIPASNWEFCPLKENTYSLLADLWKEAITATPGSEYIHIGSDETYELASCDLCKAKAAEIGKSGLYLLFVNKASGYLKPFGRKIMVWERPMGWETSSSPSRGPLPQNGLALTESYDETPDFKFAAKAKSLGYKVFGYDPNPGIEHLFLPYFYKDEEGTRVSGCLMQSCSFLSALPSNGLFEGVISTSWDDSGLHNQVWMLRFVTAAALSWNNHSDPPPGLQNSFFKSYYGANATQLNELFLLLNEGAYYYMSTFERKVWHWGEIGKTHLPDLPRGNAIEYNPFWNKEYSVILSQSQDMREKMQKALAIIETNLSAGIRNPYDFNVFRTVVNLVDHAAQTYENLSQLENKIREAHQAHFVDHALAYQALEKALAIVNGSLARRKTVLENLVTTWEQTRLPKGLSTPEKKYFFQQDRAWHFANRTPDMSYLVIDEEKLDLEGYARKLADYMDYYRKTYL